MSAMRIAIVLALLPLFAGCSPKPAELANLYPVSISVSNKGIPLEGILILLVDKEKPNAYACNALTDARGNAKITTTLGSHSTNGAREGVYSVVLSKPFSWPPELEPNEDESSLPEKTRRERQARRDEFMERNRVVPTVLESRETSPIELTVEPRRGATLAIDISKY